AVGGGALTFWLAPKYLGGVLAEESTAPKWLYWVIAAATVVPGAVAGGVVGWFVIRPVNAALAWLFAVFNPGFGRVTALYGWTVGKSLRFSTLVFVVYLGLLALTVWRVATAPTSLIPNQDQGYLLVSVQLPDSASVQRTEAIMQDIDQIARGV